MLESIRLLTNVVEIFRERCVEGIRANVERCNELVEYSMAMVTSLVPVIGYDRVGGDRQGERENRQDRAPALPRVERAAGRPTRRRAESGIDDDAGRRRERGRVGGMYHLPFIIYHVGVARMPFVNATPVEC